MRRFYSVLFSAAMLMSMPAYAGNLISDSKIIFAERQNRDIRVVMYMTSW